MAEKMIGVERSISCLPLNLKRLGTKLEILIDTSLAPSAGSLRFTIGVLSRLRVIASNFVQDRLTRPMSEVERSFKTFPPLIWLNPLLRFDAFQSGTAGICAMLSRVDPSLPEHILETLQLLPQVRAGRKPIAGRDLRTAA